ncbi:MAG: hypothetical protein QME51_09660 [Planctomycetota bacterium]|nr:hypothetical protein [Planctomycetota bacterium]
MKKALKIINEMVAKGIISNYAIGGSVGTMFYTEPYITKDIDVFTYPQILPSGLIHFESLYQYLKNRGYKIKETWVMIDNIPIDFVPVYNELIAEAVKNHIIKNYEDVKVKVVRPEYLIAIAIQTGRKQDLNKIDMLLKQTKINRELLAKILKRYKLKL